MEQENRLSVCVCREEKLVLGLSRRSSCADVIRVLLEDQNRDSGLSHAPQSFCIVEKWRGLERVLPNNTKIWRLWLAWGPGQKDVKFVLVKCDATRSSPAARSAEARVVRSEPSPGAGAGSRLGPQGVCPERQRRTVRKVFRKLRKINKRRARQDASCAERMETLVHVVLSQDHNIRQQLQRLEELEAEIELREARVHLQRVQQHGANYVQDTYLVTGDPACVNTHTLCSKKIQQFEDYVTVCEALMQLQEEIREREAQIDGLTAQIQDQLHLHRTPADTHLVHDSQLHLRRTPADTHLVHDSQLHLHRTPADTHLVHDSQLHRTPADTHLMHHSQLHRTPADTHLMHDSQLHRTPADTHLVHDSQLLLEEERIQTQLGASWYISLRLQTDLKAVKCDVELSGDIYAAKMKELNFLLQKVDALDLADVRDVAGDGRARVDSLDSQAEWLEQAKVFSSKAHVEDEDSDTGLSSLHSQDSEPQWEAVGF